jgi:WD40 repeat protein
MFLAFSSDGTLFATAGAADRLVRVWYQNQQLLLPGQPLEGGSAHPPVTYSFIYVAHPRYIFQDNKSDLLRVKIELSRIFRPVTGFSWRDTSRYMPRGAVANMLVTNCKDNICRLWSETVTSTNRIC